MILGFATEDSTGDALEYELCALFEATALAAGLIIDNPLAATARSDVADAPAIATFSAVPVDCVVVCVASVVI